MYLAVGALYAHNGHESWKKSNQKVAKHTHGAGEWVTYTSRCITTVEKHTARKRAQPEKEVGWVVKDLLPRSHPKESAHVHFSPCSCAPHYKTLKSTLRHFFKGILKSRRSLNFRKYYVIYWRKNLLLRKVTFFLKTLFHEVIIWNYKLSYWIQLSRPT